MDSLSSGQHRPLGTLSTIAVIVLLRQDILDCLIHLLGQAEADIPAPFHVLPDHDREITRAFMKSHGGLVADPAVVGTAHIDDGDSNLVCLDFGAARVLDQEDKVVYRVISRRNR